MGLTCIAEESGNLYTSTYGFRNLRIPKGYRLKFGEGFDSATVEEWHEAWNGEGLPPVGAVCERRSHADAEGGRYEEVKIIAHTSKGCPVWENTNAMFAGISKAPHMVGGFPEFRPIRTPEQIEAEKRERAVFALAEVLRGYAPQNVTAAFALYDAGYRKQEQP